MYLDGLDAGVLARIYSTYHSLCKKPHHIDQISFHGKRITIRMWEEAYIETVTFIRDGCMNSTTAECLDQLIHEFNKKYKTEKGNNTHFTFAAGSKTSNTFFHPLGSNGAAAQYAKLLPYLDFPLGIDPKKIPLFPIELTNKNTRESFYRLCKVNKKSVSWSLSSELYENKFETYELAVAALSRHYSHEFSIGKKEDSGKDRYIPKKNTKSIYSMECSMKNVSPEDLMKEFHFRGIQFGNYLPQRERQIFINNTFNSLSILSEILCVPKHWIGGGKLGLAFGARGHGYAAAHYEVELAVINLTRFNGPGSIAHEFFHSFDARMAKKWFDRQALLSNLIDKNQSLGRTISSRHRERFIAFSGIFSDCTANSNYLSNATRISGQRGGNNYWTEPAELCARAFEAYIQDVVELIGVKQQWLAFGTKEDDYPINGMHPYPCGEDRMRINLSFSKNLPVLFAKTPSGPQEPD